MNILKYYILWGFLICTVIAKGQQIEVRYGGEEPLWLPEQHQFVWDKVIPFYILKHWKSGIQMCLMHRNCFV